MTKISALSARSAVQSFSVQSVRHGFSQRPLCVYVMLKRLYALERDIDGQRLLLRAQGKLEALVFGEPLDAGALEQQIGGERVQLVELIEQRGVARQVLIFAHVFAQALRPRGKRSGRVGGRRVLVG